jgi:hypothetical protein
MALLAAVAVVAVLPSAADAAASGREKLTTAAAPTGTQLSLTRKSGELRYGRSAVLTARLTAAGKPLGGREISLDRGAVPISKGVTNAGGATTFTLKATRNDVYQARFVPVSPEDLVGYQAATSKPLQIVVRPLLRLALSSSLRAGRKIVGIAAEGVRVQGRIAPYAGGEVEIRILKHGREIRRSSRPLAKKGGGGRFGLTFKPAGRGTYTIRAERRADETLGAARAPSLQLLVVRPSSHSGSGGPAVRALQRRLSTLGYLTPVTGSFGDSTARAVLAFRKVNGMSREFSADRAMFRKLERGGGGFHLRHVKAGKHVEFDWSRQVLVLAKGTRVVRILPASSGKPSTPTVFGNFRFYGKMPGYNSKGMYYSNYFKGGYAIHGYASVPSYAASHGCIRIPIASAISVYRWIQVGDPISIYR